MQVSMWFQRRLYYIALLGNLKAFMVLAAGVIAPPPPKLLPPDAPNAAAVASRHEEDLKFASFARRSLGRHCALVLELAILKAKGVGDGPEARAWLEETGLLGPGEWAATGVKGQRQLVVISWMASALRQCVARGVLEANASVPLLSLCVDARRNSSDMMDRSLFDVYVDVAAAAPPSLVALFAEDWRDVTSVINSLPLQLPRNSHASPLSQKNLLPSPL